EHGDPYELENTTSSVESNRSADPVVQQRGCQQRLQRGPYGNDRRHREVRAQGKLIGWVEEIPQIGQESPQPDSGPDAVALEQYRSQRNARWGPNRSRFIFRRHGQRQAESRRRHIKG